MAKVVLKRAEEGKYVLTGQWELDEEEFLALQDDDSSLEAWLYNEMENEAITAFVDLPARGAQVYVLDEARAIDGPAEFEVAAPPAQRAVAWYDAEPGRRDDRFEPVERG